MMNDSRSMNEQLHRGAEDGKVRNLRPDAAAADYAHAEARARQLHPSHYGTFGQGSDSMTPFTEQMMPDYETREAKRQAGIRGY